MSFFLLLFLGTILRLLFFVINGGEGFDIELIKVFLVGIFIDGMAISIFFFPAYIFTFFKHRILKVLQSFYLYVVTFLFLLFSVIDIFFFQAFYSRFDINILKNISDFSALTGTFLTVYHKYPYGMLIVPLLLIISWFAVSPNYFFCPLKKLLNLNISLNSKSNYKIAFFHIFIYNGLKFYGSSFSHKNF